ncbi:hypothetical protein DRE_07272 [Drechslerella stenobrocha 248]|uniref:Peptidase M20 dimerisation domain-containing protein n=1 Tax=Drechslerella stenobrocha 248 TaxID=1043628 RepID=W7HVA5_9PEZI|nr:hypothetical protein DRE_07272 [Drechslerella stenobrocha 248]
MGAVSRPPPVRAPRSRYVLFSLLAGAALLGSISLHWRATTIHSSSTDLNFTNKNITALCPLVESISPGKTSPALDNALAELRTPSYNRRSADLLGAAVRLHTDITDSPGAIDEDPVWRKMGNFTRWLSQAFPLLHDAPLRLEHINSHGLLYTWPGTNHTSKPIVLTGHYDTVPVAPETITRWTHPPFSGHLDANNYLWGRGASDDKSRVIAILQAVEQLLKAGFRPHRTIILAFGFDEEIGGTRGAQSLARTLHARYGDNGIALLADEGSSALHRFGRTFMAISTSEPGIINQRITVRVPGGHSALPPPHTGIGIMADLVRDIERHPYTIRLAESSPLRTFLGCAAAHAPGFPAHLKRLVESGDDQRLAEAVSESSEVFAAQVRTTIAVTRIDGGVKVNALPESVVAYANHRVRMGSSSAEVKEGTARLAAAVAQRYGLKLLAYPEHTMGEGPGEREYPQSSITLELVEVREPAPVTDVRSQAYKLVAGTTRAVLGDGFVVSPTVNFGNTDTFWYWRVTNHIFRYTPLPEAGENIHTVDERISMTAYAVLVEWFFVFIRNADEADLQYE